MVTFHRLKTVITAIKLASLTRKTSNKRLVSAQAAFCSESMDLFGDISD